MELWVSILLLAVCVAGFFLAARLLTKRPAARRLVMLACLILGAMLLLYSCLTGFLLAFAAPDPETPEDAALAVTEPVLSADAMYLSLDGLEARDGVFYLRFTAMDADMTPLSAGELPLDENLQSSMLPGWDERGERVALFTAKDFAQYWAYAGDQGFPAVGSLCRYTLDGDIIRELNEIDPARLIITE